jgi:hypothetical protein
VRVTAIAKGVMAAAARSSAGGRAGRGLIGVASGAGHCEGDLSAQHPLVAMFCSLVYSAPMSMTDSEP